MREEFRARMEQAGAAEVWQNFPGRIATVLSGGGAQGAYEAGALLAFQDAALPMHILTASSVGSINAAAYTANSATRVGNAEGLVETWFGLTPAAVGIEWTRYAWTLGGLIAAAAGFGNLARHLLSERGFQLHLHDPAITWMSLGLAGVAVLLFYIQLPYLGHVVANYFHPTAWRPDTRKALLSLVANLVVWGFAIIALHSLHIHTRLAQFFLNLPIISILVLVALAAVLLMRHRWLSPVNKALHRALRLPLRPGLFANFERGRLLRLRFTSDQIRDSPIRVVFTLTELESGTGWFFTNANLAELAEDPGVDSNFIRQEMATTEDLVRAVVASSALPIVYEPISLDGKVYSDGGMVTNQPIRPALRLGADVLFLVIVEPPGAAAGEMKTFLDVGLRALRILMTQSLLNDLKILNSVNALCERAAAELSLRPEEVEIDFGTRRYRYARAFTIQPEKPLGGAVLDFDAKTLAPLIVMGYRNACAQIESFLDYAPQTRYGRPRRLLRYSPVPQNS